MAEYIFQIALLVFIYMNLVYLPARLLKDWSVVDVAWGPGFFLVSLSALILSDNYNIISYSLIIMTFLWALRLALHIGLRKIGQPEDFRYANWRKEWQPYPELQGYFRVFMLQGSIMIVVALPLILGMKFSTETSEYFYHLPGLLLFLIGFTIESLSDLQLNSFKKKRQNSGKLISSGLWSISRHPNYLGEIILWWGIAFFVLPLNYGFIGLLGPLCIHLIIRYISIPKLEEKWEEREDWSDIKENIPILFPGI